MKIRITNEQENELLQILIEAAKNPSPQNEKIAQGAYLKLFELMHPLIYAVSKIYLKSGVNEKEIVGNGKKGFKKAVNLWVDKYKDGSRPKYKFSTYATWHIRAEIHRRLGLPIK